MKNRWSLKRSYWQWRGRTKEGASRYVGSQEGPSPWAIRLLLGLACAEVVAAVGFLAGGLFGHANLGAAGGLSLGAAVHGLVGWWFIRQRRRIHGMVDQQDAAEWLGVEAEEVDALLKEQAIRPKYNINGVDYYDREDFGDVATLLRAADSHPEQQPQVLLRPAGSGETDADLLMRAASEDDAQLPITEQKPAPEAPAEQELSAGSGPAP